MKFTNQTIGQTSRTLVDILRGPDCPERQERVAALVSIYKPVWENVAKGVLISYGAANNATLDATDVVGDEILKMLDPKNDYFKKKRPGHGSLRAWIKSCIRHRVIDILRRKSVASQILKKSVSEEEKNYIDSLIEEREMCELFRQAMIIAEELCNQRGWNEDMAIFRMIKLENTKSDNLQPSGNLTEWRKRSAVNRIWNLIRDEAIPAAAAKVAESQADAVEFAQTIWDKMRRKKAVNFPE